MSFEYAVNFIKKSEEAGHPKNYHIGILTRSLSSHKAGDVVVFSVDDPSKASEREKLFWGRDHSQDPVTLVVENPYPPEIIRERIIENNGTFSNSLGVNVHSSYVKKIKGLNLKIRVGLESLMNRIRN
jgi:hypothetical protein